MNAKTLLLPLLALGLASLAAAETRAGVWVYQPDGNSYRIESGPRQYDPRSPYPQYRQYPQNLPPRYQGQLPPRYYDRHLREDPRRHWHPRDRYDERRPRWQHERRFEEYRPPIINGRGYRLDRRDDHPQRPYRDDRGRNW